MTRGWTRRSLLEAGGATAASLVWPRSLQAKPIEPLGPLPLSPAVTVVGSGKARHEVVDAAFLTEQIDNANRIYAPFGVSFENGAERSLDARFAALEDRADRDALADELDAEGINVFFVESLRDVDDPARMRMGVTWRKLTNLKKRYIVVASSAHSTTMAHELGHFLGLDHTSVKNNLMSYDRDGGEVFLDARQGQTVRRRAAILLETKDLGA